jgi:hypothetical protein
VCHRALSARGPYPRFHACGAPHRPESRGIQDRTDRTPAAGPGRGAHWTPRNWSPGRPTTSRAWPPNASTATTPHWSPSWRTPRGGWRSHRPSPGRPGPVGPNRSPGTLPERLPGVATSASHIGRDRTAAALGAATGTRKSRAVPGRTRGAGLIPTMRCQGRRRLCEAPHRQAVTSPTGISSYR